MAIYYQEPLDRTFHALGDRTRRQILSTLAKNGACSANELREPFNSTQPTISKHLKVLEKAGLVTRAIDGRTHRFRFEAKPMKEAEDWMERHQAFWEGTLQRLEDFMDNTEKLGD